MGLKTKHREPPKQTHPCSWPECTEEGAFPAPVSRSKLRNFRWFCLEHVRLYNQAWDYFSGMSEAEVAQYQIDALHGHNPTWKMGINSEQHALFLHQKVMDELARLQGIAPIQAHKPNPLPQKERDALALFGLAYPVSLKEIKKRYKELVKRYHPDINNNDKQREERFKTISLAYTLLIKSGFFS